MSLAPGETRTITLVFAWHFPHRMYIGQELGNQYAAGGAAAGVFNDSLGVARYAAVKVRGLI